MRRCGMNARHAWAAVAALGCGWLLAESPQKPPSLEEALVKARVDGKYQMLLRQIKAPDDEKEHGAFKDLGLQTRDGQAGHWVYVAPYWYVWRDLAAAAPQGKRAWGPEQMIG